MSLRGCAQPQIHKKATQDPPVPGLGLEGPKGEWEGEEGVDGVGRRWEQGLWGGEKGIWRGRLEESPGSGMGTVSVPGAIATIHASPCSQGPPAC